MTPDLIAANITARLPIDERERSRLNREITAAILEERRQCAKTAAQSWQNLAGDVDVEQLYNYSVVVNRAARAILQRPVNGYKAKPVSPGARQKPG